MEPGRGWCWGLVIAALSVAPAGSAAAQTSAAAGWQLTPASQLKGTLRALAAAQARHWVAHGTYAPSVIRLGLMPQPDVQVEILGASSTGWKAKAAHRTRPGKSCVIFVGPLNGAELPTTDADRGMAGESGVPLCDRMR
jgi:hypothetical protein